jgi:putative serine protease PepD
MDAPEGTQEVGKGNRGRRRLLLIPATFVAGVVAAAGVITGFGVADSSSPGAAVSATASTATASIAQKAASLDAETIYRQDSPGVVDITVTESASQNQISPFSPSGSQQATAEGTGYVYDKSGHIITADHVVSGASKITVRFQDGSTATATLVGADASTDTAVIKVSVPESKLTPLALANSSTVAPGEGVVAIGSPFGYSESITAGIVSAVDRTIQAPNGYSISNTIQTDAAINHGNSGGPLIDSTGKVVGTNVQIAVDDQTSSSVNAGVGFAVPSNTVKSVADSLIAGKAVQHAYLGVSVGNSTSGSGAQVGTVRAGSPAATAGLKQGDVITAIDGKAVADANALTAVVGSHQPGDTISVTVKRGDATMHLSVKLGTRPASTNA